jgi:hypothetical protein
MYSEWCRSSGDGSFLPPTSASVFILLRASPHFAALLDEQHADHTGVYAVHDRRRLLDGGRQAPAQRPAVATATQRDDMDAGSAGAGVSTAASSDEDEPQLRRRDATC